MNAAIRRGVCLEVISVPLIADCDSGNMVRLTHNRATIPAGCAHRVSAGCRISDLERNQRLRDVCSSQAVETYDFEKHQNTRLRHHPSGSVHGDRFAGRRSSSFVGILAEIPKNRG